MAFPEYSEASPYSVFRDAARAPVALGHGSWGGTWKAFHHGLQCHAALKAIPVTELGGQAGREHFLGALHRAAALRHPHLASVFPPVCTGEEILYARELAEGESLPDFRTRRGPLMHRAAVLLVQQIGAALEAAAAAGLQHGSLHAGNVLVFEDEERLVARLVDFGLPARTALPTDKFAPPERLAGAPPDERASVFFLGALLRYLLPEPSETLAELLREALREAPDGRPGLGEFRRRLAAIKEPPARPAPVLEEHPTVSAYATVAEPPEAAPAPGEPPAEPPEKIFTEVTVRAQPEEPAAGGGLTIPPELLSVAEPGSLLTLKSAGGVSLRIFAGEVFRLGRSRECSLVARFLPRSQENDARTWRLSKVQCFARLEEGKIVFYDGEGRQRSTNGSKIDRRPLSPETAFPLERNSILDLASDYPIAVRPCLSPAVPEPPIGNAPLWPGPPADRSPPVHGAVTFASDPSVGRVTVIWLLGRAPFHLDSAGELSFGASGNPSGLLRHHRGCFWLEGRAAGELLVGGHRLQPDEVAPLATGQLWQIGGAEWGVEIAGEKPA